MSFLGLWFPGRSGWTRPSVTPSPMNPSLRLCLPPRHTEASTRASSFPTPPRRGSSSSPEGPERWALVPLPPVAFGRHKVNSKRFGHISKVPFELTRRGREHSYVGTLITCGWRHSRGSPEARVASPELAGHVGDCNELLLIVLDTVCCGHFFR